MRAAPPLGRGAQEGRVPGVENFNNDLRPPGHGQRSWSRAAFSEPLSGPLEPPAKR